MKSIEYSVVLEEIVIYTKNNLIIDLKAHL